MLKMKKKFNRFMSDYTDNILNQAYTIYFLELDKFENIEVLSREEFYQKVLDRVQNAYKDKTAIKDL